MKNPAGRTQRMVGTAPGWTGRTFWTGTAWGRVRGPFVASGGSV